MTLYDGSHVILNTDSRISLPKSFDGKTRIARLTGEAYFDVNADPSKMFIVKTPTLTVTVLGTRFNVRSFDDRSQSKVSLLSGKVTISGNAVSGEIALVEMTPGLQYSLNLKDRSGKIQPVDTATAIQWTKPQPDASASRQRGLIFDQDTLASVLSKLEARFGVGFEMNDVALAQKTISAHFETESLKDILAILHLAGAFEYEVIRSADKITTVNLWSSKPSGENRL